MGEENRSLLEEEIKAEIKRLGSLESGSQEHTTAVDINMTVLLCDSMIAFSIVGRQLLLLRRKRKRRAISPIDIKKKTA